MRLTARPPRDVEGPGPAMQTDGNFPTSIEICLIPYWTDVAAVAISYYYSVLPLRSILTVPNMTSASSIPLAELASLPKADGSASFSHCGYAVTAAVNGPIEAPRRDENPFEALIDVVVRPAAGVGGMCVRNLFTLAVLFFVCSSWGFPSLMDLD